MTMDENVAKALERVDFCVDREKPVKLADWRAIRARLVELEAENERLRASRPSTALVTKAQKIVRDVWETWYPGNEWQPATDMHDLLCQIGNSLLGIPEFARIVDSRLHTQNLFTAHLSENEHG